MDAIDMLTFSKLVSLANERRTIRTGLKIPVQPRLCYIVKDIGYFVAVVSTWLNSLWIHAATRDAWGSLVFLF